MTNRTLNYYEAFCAVSERRAAGTGLVSLVASFSGPLDQIKAIDATCQLQGRHYLLQAKIDESDDHHLAFDNSFYENLDEEQRRDILPLVFHHRRVPSEWRNIAHRECDRLLPMGDISSSYLWRFHLIVSSEPDGPHELLLIADHAIVDGLSVSCLACEFLKLLNGCKLHGSDDDGKSTIPIGLASLPPPDVASSDPTVRKNSSPPPPSARRLTNAYPFESAAPLQDRSACFLWRVVDAQVTRGILRACRREGVRLNGFLAAALARSVSNCFLLCDDIEKESTDGGYNSSKHPQLLMPLVIAANLRNECIPPVGRNVVGSFVNVLCTDVVVNPNNSTERCATIWDSARTAQVGITQAFQAAQGSGFIPRDYDIRELRRATDDGLRQMVEANAFSTPLAITNIGLVDTKDPFSADDDPAVGGEEESTNRQHRLLDMYFWTVQKGGHFLLPVHVLTLEDRLHFTFSYPHPLLGHDTATLIADDFIAQLRQHSDLDPSSQNIELYSERKPE